MINDYPPYENTNTIEIGRYLKPIEIYNFFTDEELDIIKNYPKDKLNTITDEVTNNFKKYQLHGWYHHFNLDGDPFGITNLVSGDIWIKKVLNEKFEKYFFKGLDCLDCHILESVYPYTFHHDINHKPLFHAPNPAWTIIIPLDNYNSYTITTKQQPELNASKTIGEWIKNENPPKLNNCISKEMWEQYLTHNDDTWFREYLELENIYKWKKNVAFASSRFSFHGSDNFLRCKDAGNEPNWRDNNYCKKALILWTSF